MCSIYICICNYIILIRYFMLNIFFIYYFHYFRKVPTLETVRYNSGDHLPKSYLLQYVTKRLIAN